MKVKISNYPNRIISRVYTNYMTNKYSYVAWPKVQSRFENFLEKLEDFLQTCYSPINYFLDKRVQKVSVKIDRWDTWSMDHTLAYIIVPMLKQLKEEKHGAPMVDNEDVPLDLHMPNKWYEDKYNRNGETDPHFFDRWDWVMGEMIWAFEQKTIDWEEQYYGEWVEDESKMFGGHHINADDEGRKKHHERMVNGFRLFGKYYECLWD